MKVHTSLSDFNANRPVLTIGTFDGVHLGHQKVIRRLREITEKHGGETVIFTFSAHPRLITAPNDTSLRLLTTLNEKIELFAKYGIDHLVVYPFDKAFSEMSYAEFVEKILVDQIGTYSLVVGHDHKFGKNREGDFGYLQQCAAKFNFGIERLDALFMEDENVSSTRIRKALQRGDIRKANHYLGYEFTLHGTIVAGKQLGRLMGFPTANIQASDVHKIIPGYGVYAVKMVLNNQLHFGMMNIGIRPTFNKNADNRSIEVNIFDFDEDVYGREIKLMFVSKIRDEIKFDNAQMLVSQLVKDKISALEMFERL